MALGKNDQSFHGALILFANTKTWKMLKRKKKSTHGRQRGFPTIVYFTARKRLKNIFSFKMISDFLKQSLEIILLQPSPAVTNLIDPRFKGSKVNDDSIVIVFVWRTVPAPLLDPGFRKELSVAA